MFPCAKGCCTEEVTIIEEGENWVIRRRPGFKPLPEHRQPEPEYPGILITPGQDPEDPFHIVPVEVVYPKKYGTLKEVVEEIVPKMRQKEETCTVCAKVKQFLQSVSNR